MHTTQTRPGIWDGNWSELYGIPVGLFGVTVAANADGRLEMIGVIQGPQYIHTAQTQPGSWDGGAWSRLAIPPEPTTGFRVASNADGRLELFAVFPGGNGLDSDLWRTAQMQPGNWDDGW